MAGKCQMAREGKIVAGRKPKYGFSFTADKDSLLMDEEQMAVVRRIFEMVGPEAKTINATRLALNREGVPTASGARAWSAQAVRANLLDGAYKPHTYQEIGELVSADVLRSLDPKRLCGVWWFNRRKYAKDRRIGKRSTSGVRGASG